MANKINSVYDVFLSPVNTEKAVRQRDGEERVKYSFYVNPAANKPTIVRAVKGVFGKDIHALNIVNLPAKSKRFRGKLGTRAGRKKAIFTLVAGQKLENI